ncbi:MAG: restriction endonuclease subunit S [Ignavibacteriaceae bacterium]
MKWNKIEFGELYLIPSKNGLNRPSRVRGDGYKMINMGELFANDRIKNIPMELVPLNDREKETSTVLENDLLFARQSILASGAGKCSIILETPEITTFESHLIRVRLNRKIANPLFYYYYFRTSSANMKSLVQQGVQAGIRGSELKSLNVIYPPLPLQDKIASILSAYDDLIDNNLKRIKLLEEKAQLHYKELMQEMLFAKTKREEYIKDCLSFYIGGGWGEDQYKEKFTEPAYVIRGTDIPDVRKGNIKGVPFRYHKESNLASRKLEVGDIIFEVSNGQINNIGRTGLVSQKLLDQFDKPVMCASFAKLIRLNEKVTPEFFYLYLNESQENGLLYQYKSNSANGINNFAFETFIEEVKILLPKENELKTLTEKVKPIFTLIATLGEQNSKLREARDILLPRLMSGEVGI